MQRTSLRAVLACLLLALPLLVASEAAATTITVLNLDGAGEGFNDPSPRAPVGGNPGTTLGAQRLNAFQHGANIWAGLVSSPVEIKVGATFDPLPCTMTTATLGQAGPHTFIRDYAGAPIASTWYPIALANSFAGMDLDAGNDIDAQFNSSLGVGACASFPDFYYGFDASPPSGSIDFVTVIVHELCHGLGFLTIVDVGNPTSTGAKAGGFDDVFMRDLEDHSLALLWPPMTNAQRLTSSTDTGDLHWVGASVVAAGGFLTAGRDPVSGHVQMFAPNPAQPGSSVSHWDTAVTPNEIMEPVYTGPMHDPRLAVNLLADIGWTVTAVTTTTTTTSTTTTTLPDDTGFIAPDAITGKCEDGVAKALSKYASGVIKCHIKAADSAVKGVPLDDELCESSPTTGKGAKEKFDAAIAKLAATCSGCAIANAPGLRAATESFLDSHNDQIYCAGATSFPGADDAGSVPPDAVTGKCEDGVAKALAKYTGAVIKCHTKAAQSGLKGLPHDDALCESSPTTGKGAKEKFDAAVAKLALTCGGCAITNAPGARAATESFLDAQNGQVYCAGTTPF